MMKFTCLICGDETLMSEAEVEVIGDWNVNKCEKHQDEHPECKIEYV